jgi:hypothetical protein
MNEVVTIATQIGLLSGVLTLLSVVWSICMWCLGINVLSIIRGDKLLIIEAIKYTVPRQYIVDVALVHANRGITQYIGMRASEWGIDTTHASDDTTWVRHETDSYAVYAKRDR